MAKLNQKLELLISEDELRDLIRGEEFKWTLATKEGEDIDVLVRLERDEDREIESDDEEIDEDEESDEDEMDDDSEEGF